MENRLVSGIFSLVCMQIKKALELFAVDRKMQSYGNLPLYSLRESIFLSILILKIFRDTVTFLMSN